MIVVLDAGRPDYLGCYGHRWNQNGISRSITPNIDRIASEGTLFEKATTVAPWTVPSHASMFTGLYPNQHQANWNTLKIKTGIPTIFDIFKERGYHSVACVANDTLIFPCRMFGEQTEIFGLQGRKDPNLSGFVDGFSAKDSNSECVINWFLNWLDKSTCPPKRREDQKTPFIAYLNIYDSHTKYDAPEPFRSQFISPEEDRILKEIGTPFYLHFREMNREIMITPEHISALKSLYTAKMAMIDYHLGRLFERLAKDKILDETILIITSDHGDQLGDHTYPSFHHQFSIYNALTWIPLIWRAPILSGRAPGLIPACPEKIGAGQRIGVPLIQNIDILPTILELCGIKWQSPLKSPGISLSRYILNQNKTPPRPYAIAMYEAPRKFVNWNKQNVNPLYIRNLLAIQDARHKVIFSEDGTEELYDINKDPTEQNNIKNQLPQTVKEFKRIFYEILDEYGGIPEDYQVSDVSYTPEEEAQIKKRFQELGYIE